MLYEKRKNFSGFEAKIGKFFSKLPLTPNQWTLLSLILALFTFYFLYIENFVLAAISFALAAFFDIVDGNVARTRKVATVKGAYYDTIVDRYVEFLIILALFFIGLPALWLIAYLFGSTMTTYAKAAAREKNLTKD